MTTLAIDFGTDISTFPDLDPTFSTISGTRVIAEAIARRWTTSPGAYLPDPTYGWDTRQLLHLELSPAVVAAAQVALSNEATRDERIIACDVAISSPGSGAALITATITTSGGPFTLVLSVSALTVALLSPT